MPPDKCTVSAFTLKSVFSFRINPEENISCKMLHFVHQLDDICLSDVWCCAGSLQWVRESVFAENKWLLCQKHRVDESTVAKSEQQSRL